MIYLYLVSLIIAGLTTILAFSQVKRKRSLKSIFLPLEIQGSFVWADGIIFGPFWFLVSLGFLSVKPENWRWFATFFLVFWLIRSTGEVIYWLNNQFQPLRMDKLNSQSFLFLKNFFHQSNYIASFVYQIFWQCVSTLCLFGLIWLLFSMV